MSNRNLCDKEYHDITDFSKCTEHPFTTIVKIIECASKYDKKYKVLVPSGTIPFNVLLEYIKKYKISFDVNEKGSNTEFIFYKE